MQKPNLLVFAACCLACLAVADDPNVVQIKAGKIRGFVPPNATHRAFRGVPYAAPPVGKLRWTEPQPIVPWGSTIRPATDFGPPCKQLGPAWTTMEGVANDGSSEDCLCESFSRRSIIP